MAFTEAQRVQIRKWLGYADAHRQINTWVESAIDLVGTYPDSQTEVESILAKLATIDPTIDASLTTGGLKRAEDIEWYESGAEFSSKAMVGRMYCNRLSTLFGVPLGADAFANGPGLSAPFALG